MEKEEFVKLSEELNESMDNIKKDIKAKATKEDIETKFNELNDKFGDLVKSEDYKTQVELAETQQKQLDTIAADIKTITEGGTKGTEGKSVMKQVVIFIDTDHAELMKEINEELIKWDGDNIDLIFNQSMNDIELIFSCMVIIKDCR